MDMKSAFLSSMTEKLFWVWDEAFSGAEVFEVFKYAQVKFEQGYFREALVGKARRKKKVPSVRSDRILWLAQPFSEELDLIYKRLIWVKETAGRGLYLPIKRFESQLAYYGPGDFYVKHVDRHRASPSRVLTSVIYLSSWEPGAGGELVLYNEHGDVAEIVEPRAGRMVVFDSRLAHEVRKVSAHRWSLTTWFRDDIEGPVQL